MHPILPKATGPFYLCVFVTHAV